MWKQKQEEASVGCGVLRRRITDLEDRRRQLLEAHVYRKAIDEEIYRREDDRLSQEITVARLELNDAVLEELDIEGLLAFAEVVDGRRAALDRRLVGSTPATSNRPVSARRYVLA